MAVADWLKQGAGFPGDISALVGDAPLLQDVAPDDLTTGYGGSAAATVSVCAVWYFSAGAAVDRVRFSANALRLFMFLFEHSADGAAWTQIYNPGTDSPVMYSGALTGLHIDKTPSGGPITANYWRLSVQCVPAGPGGTVAECHLTDFRLYSGGTEHSVGTPAPPPPPAARRRVLCSTV